MDKLETFVGDTLSGNLWAVIPWLLLAAGGYFGIRTVVVQLRMIPEMMRRVVEKPSDAVKEAGHEGLSAFKAFTISAASRVGTGNVAGVAIAITVGGPGAVFWMWIIALVGGATAFVEATLAQVWKVHDIGSNYRGGPAYYMTRGLHKRGLATIFAIAISITFGLIYNALQTNAMVEALSVSIGANSTTTHVILGAAVTLLTALVIFGGVERIANVTQWMVPFMAGAYVIMGLVVLALNVEKIPELFSTIVLHALGVKEVVGATVGQAFMHGMRRGLFSNEAGEGSAPNAAATATISHPVKQGLVQTLGVYFDTLLVCSITAFIILLSDPQFGEELASSSLTQSALASQVGTWGIHFVTVVIFFLAFSSIIGNYYLAQANIQFLTDSYRLLQIFRGAVLFFVFFGAIASVSLVWSLGDLFAGIMVVINLCAIVPLSGVAVKLLKNYQKQLNAGLDPVFIRGMMPELKNLDAWDGSDPIARPTPAHWEALGLQKSNSQE